MQALSFGTSKILLHFFSPFFAIFDFLMVLSHLYNLANLLITCLLLHSLKMDVYLQHPISIFLNGSLTSDV